MLRSVRDDPGHAPACGWLVCAHSRGEQGEAWITGTDGYLVHPFEADELVAEVAAVVGRPDDERDDAPPAPGRPVDPRRPDED